eukprot:200484-Pleurochrysis_carterae.AAC.5
MAARDRGAVRLFPTSLMRPRLAAGCATASTPEPPPFLSLSAARSKPPSRPASMPTFRPTASTLS